jgi:CRISPR system Cascade subunit CasE
MTSFSRASFVASSRDEIRQLNQLRTSPYSQHQALWTLFDRPEGTQQPFVFRALSDEPRVQRFYLVSAEPPRADSSVWSIESKPYTPRLSPGQRFQFNVRLNPTRSERVPGQRGKRQDYVISRLHELGVPETERAAARHRIVHEELPQWLADRGAQHGFDLEHASVQSHVVHRFARDRNRVTLSVAELSGVLQVTDPEALMRTLTHGLGHGRSFGLGLLLLKPVR